MILVLIDAPCFSNLVAGLRFSCNAVHYCIYISICTAWTFYGPVPLRDGGYTLNIKQPVPSRTATLLTLPPNRASTVTYCKIKQVAWRLPTLLISSLFKYILLAYIAIYSLNINCCIDTVQYIDTAWRAPNNLKQILTFRFQQGNSLVGWPRPDSQSTTLRPITACCRVETNFRTLPLLSIIILYFEYSIQSLAQRVGSTDRYFRLLGPHYYPPFHSIHPRFISPRVHSRRLGTKPLCCNATTAPSRICVNAMPARPPRTQELNPHSHLCHTLSHPPCAHAPRTPDATTPCACR